jgi:hypothetical protein
MNTPERLLAWVGAFLLAVALTWPLAPKLGSVGRLDSGDARYSIWNVAWVARALVEDPPTLYDANIFHPQRGTLAYSEPNLLAGVLAAPVWKTTANPHAASNWVILLSFVLSSVTTYALARRLSGSRFGAAVAAVSFAYCGFVFAHLAHVQLLLTFVLPLTLLSMHRFVDVPSIGRALAFGAAVALSGLASGYYGVMAGIAAALGVIWFGFASGRYREGRYWTLAVAAAGVALAITWPVFQPLAVTEFGRNPSEALLFSANWQAYFASPRPINRWLLKLIGDGTWREVLFPGWVPLTLGLFAVAAALRPARLVTAPSRSLAGFYAVLGVFGLWASLGPAAGLYGVLQNTLPFFSLLRASARFGILVTLALSILAAFGAVAIAPRVRAAWRRPAAAAVIGFAIVTADVGTLPFSTMPRLPESYRRLSWMPREPVVVFPYFWQRGERHRHTEYMLYSTYHWQPLVNGYSDYTPQRSAENAPRLGTFPDLEAWNVMRGLGVRYVVIHWDFYEGSERTRIVDQVARQWRYLRPVVEDAGVGLFEVIAWPGVEQVTASQASEPSGAEAGPRPR